MAILIERLLGYLRLLLSLRRGFIFKNYDLPAEDADA